MAHRRGGTMKPSTGIVAVLLLALTIFPPNSGVAESDVLLPADIKIVEPGASVLPKRAAFSGRWSGVWDKTLYHVLIVEEIINDEAMVVYAYGDAPAWRVKAGYSRVKGAFDSQNRLELQLASQRRAVYEMMSSGSLSGTYYLTYQDGRREMYLGTFTREQLAR